jgi:hypothetical protein
LGGQAGRGGRRRTAVWRLSKASCQGQFWGRWSFRRRAVRARRAGMLIRCARIVVVVARVWNGEASAPVARVRLCAIAHKVAQAALAWNDADGR